MMRKAEVGSEERVQATAGDAAAGKLSAASLGYFEDPFLEVLVGATSSAGDNPVRRLPPIINRGNFARVSCIEKLVVDFIGTSTPSMRHAVGQGGGSEGEETSCGESKESSTRHQPRKPQVISLGAGKDSLFFRLRDRGVFPAGGWLEVDFPTVSTWKAKLVEKTPILANLASDLYKVIPADLRGLPALEEALIKAGVDFSAPTLFLAECVLVYMEPAESAGLLQWCASTFPDSLMAAYEMTSPHDAFGKMMKQNIQRMGCLLPGLEPYPSLLSQEERFKSAGWDAVRASDMLVVYQNFLDPIEVRRIAKIEVLDEVEEWELIMRHYCLVVAARGRGSEVRLSKMS